MHTCPIQPALYNPAEREPLLPSLAEMSSFEQRIQAVFVLSRSVTCLPPPQAALFVTCAASTQPMASTQAKRINAQRTMQKLNTRKEERAKLLHARRAAYSLGGIYLYLCGVRQG